MFARGDYGRANSLYGQLLAADKTRTDLEMKHQKALLLATLQKEFADVMV